jgi:hypothetical protein
MLVVVEGLGVQLWLEQQILSRHVGVLGTTVIVVFNSNSKLNFPAFENSFSSDPLAPITTARSPTSVGKSNETKA